jgi:hypothetical protein
MECAVRTRKVDRDIVDAALRARRTMAADASVHVRNDNRDRTPRS